jgi:Nif-specific regulatory protein
MEDVMPVTMPRSGARQPGALATLLELSQALANAGDLRSGLAAVLEVLARDLGAVHGLVVLRDDSTGMLRVEATTPGSAEARRASFRPGEGVLGRAVETGKQIVVPQASREPLLLNRTLRRVGHKAGELSYFCVPILLSGQAVGVVSIDVPYRPQYDFDGTAALLGIVATLIAQALRIQHLSGAAGRRLLDENGQLRHELQAKYDFTNLVGTSSPMRQVYEQIAQVSGTSTTVLIRGESGTGKELIAHALHYNSPRADRPFVKVSCAALPDSLIESELFGYEKGAFTGAQSRKKGRFEMAHGGTIFLDEIGDLNPTTQVKLLRVLQEREIERLGGTSTVHVDVRLIAATNMQLEQAIVAGSFREDLYYRLNVFSLFVPPLRERKPDILLLADHFLERYVRAHRRQVKRISTPAIDMLTGYHWPGNVRELENAIERAVVICDGGVIHGHHLPPTLQTAEASGTGATQTLDNAVGALERDLIQDALKSARGNNAKAARLLGTTERVLRYKVRKYALDAKRFRG